jgi:glycosyltransferase involved in cell wall biosynthesis
MVVAARSSEAESQGGPLTRRPVICLSNGFQTSYERGFCNALAENGVAVTLVGSDNTDLPGLHAAVRVVNLRGSQDAHRPVWRKLFNLLRYYLSILPFVARRRDSVVHVMGLLWPLVWCGLVQALWLKVFCHRYVLTVHDVLPHGRHDRLTRMLCRLAYVLPDSLVVHTQRMRERLSNEFGVSDDRIVVMEHGIEFPDMPSVTTAASGPDETGVVTILAFGGVASRKGIDMLLESLRLTRFECRLVIAGECVDDVYRARLDDLISVHPRRQDIVWHDRFVDEAEIPILFGAASVVVLPYRYIDQSGVLFQALRFGVPIVATQVGEFDRYVTAEVGVLSRPEDAEAFALALEAWYLRRATYSRERIRALAGQYDWTMTVRCLVRAYR